MAGTDTKPDVHSSLSTRTKTWSRELSVKHAVFSRSEAKSEECCGNASWAFSPQTQCQSQILNTKTTSKLSNKLIWNISRYYAHLSHQTLPRHFLISIYKNLIWAYLLTSAAPDVSCQVLEPWVARKGGFRRPKQTLCVTGLGLGDCWRICEPQASHAGESSKRKEHFVWGKQFLHFLSPSLHAILNFIELCHTALIRTSWKLKSMFQYFKVTI